jgi:hypothetical protein
MATTPNPKTPPFLLIRGKSVVGEAPDAVKALDLAEALNEPGTTYVYAPTGDFFDLSHNITPVIRKGKTS